MGFVTVMGQRYFPVHWRGADPERATMLGMSFLIGALEGSGHCLAHCSRPAGLDIRIGACGRGF